MKNQALKYMFAGAALISSSILSTFAQEPISGVDSVLIRSNSARWYEIKSLARPKGDRIVLRWAPDSYVAWRYLCGYGYNIVRFEYDDQGSFDVDTLATELKPMSRTMLQEHFAASDSLAGAATTLIYGQGTQQRIDHANGFDAIIAMSEEQDTRYSMAMLLADLRFDLAEAMALAYVDHNVKPGARYEYLIHAAVPDTILPVRTQSLWVDNNKEELPPYQPQITDSVSSMHSITLRWPYDDYTAYDIEVRDKQGQWERKNNRPYMMITTMFDPATEYNHYDVAGLDPGDHEFRIRAYDAFGDTTSYSPVYTATLPDLEPPTAPRLRYFEIDRKIGDRIFADIHWTKDSIEGDLAGYDIYYYHETIGEEWRKLNDKLIAPSDTVFRAEVSGLASGFVAVLAIDDKGNSSASTPYELHIADLVPPSAPTGLSYKMSPRGEVTISWHPSPEKDVRFYQLYVANDTTHTFLPRAGSLVRDTIAYDTIAVVGINQRHIYYRVKAFDYSGNQSEFSDVLTVERLNYDAPERCRIDSLWQEDRHVYSRWYKALNKDVNYYRIFRRISGAPEWDLIKQLSADEVSGDFILVDDSTDYVPDHSLEYAVETVNFTGISSGLSLPVRIKHWGPSIRDIAVSLKGKYLTDKKVIELTWTLPNKCPEDFYLVLHSDKGNGALEDWEFSRIESIEATQNTHHIYWLKRSETARFYMQIYWRDGTRGVPSDIVTITNPFASFSKEETAK